MLLGVDLEVKRECVERPPAIDSGQEVVRSDLSFPMNYVSTLLAVFCSPEFREGLMVRRIDLKISIKTKSTGSRDIL